MIRVAAAGDQHFGADSAGKLRGQLEELPDRADLFLLAGDLTKAGTAEEAAVLAAEVRDLGVPTVAVLGNHDYHSDQQDSVVRALESAGIQVLVESATTIEVDGVKVGIAGTKGFGGGFAGACATDFGEREMKDFVWHSRALADRLGEALDSLSADVRIGLLHYSPVRETLHGEPLEIYPFLGSYLLAEVIDEVGCDFVLHGHAHHGSEHGRTNGGAEVRNVALPVIRHAYNLYELSPRERAAAPAGPDGARANP